MKVVINTCFGGFGLSPEAILELWKRGGPVKATPVKEYFGDRMDDDESILGFNKSIDSWRDYLALKHKESRMFLTVFSPDESLVLYADGSDGDRADPKLVAIVEEMGEKASGQCASLRVVEIPDGTEYTIEEYDGNEHIAEKHRTWR